MTIASLECILSNFIDGPVISSQSKIKKSKIVKHILDIQLIMPSAFDEAGIRMLDSIREIFDILKFEFETVDFDLIQYNNFEELASALNNGKCPVVDVLGEGGMSHVMVATGIINVNGTEYIQLKNSYADNPFEQGEVQKIIFQFGGIAGNFFLIFSNFSQTFITNYITKA